MLHRIGLQALTYGATVEGFGLGASGRIGDPWGSIKQFRTANDQGVYFRVRELSKESDPDEFEKPYTLRGAMKSARNKMSH